MSESKTLTDALGASCAGWGDRCAIVSRTGEELSYASLHQRARALASGYARIGIMPGDRILCQLSNCPEQIIALYGAWMRGAVHAGADRLLTPPELASLASVIEPAVIVYEPPRPEEQVEALRTLREHCPDATIILKSATISPGCLSLSDLLAEPYDVDPETPQHAADAPAVIFFTSGSTGKPKAAIGGHENLQRRWMRLASKLAFDSRDVHFAHLPLAHGFGLMMAMSGLLTGGRLVLMDGFSRRQVESTLEREKITVLNGSPAHFQLLNDWFKPPAKVLQGVRIAIGSGAAFPLPLLQTILNEWGTEFMLMYGSSEGVGVVTTDREDILRGSVGRPMPASVAILNAEGQPLPAGEPGEISFSRRVFPVRYFRENNHSDQAPEEWYRSGDRGRMDESGRLYVLGRLHHQINRGGLKIDPAEVEQAVHACSNVADVSVIGVPDGVVGERVFAFVVPASGHSLTLQSLRDELRGRLAAHKLPDGLRLMDRIPRTAVGKADLASLRTELGETAWPG